MTLDDFKIELGNLAYENLKSLYEYCYCGNDISLPMKKVEAAQKYIIDDSNKEFEQLFKSFKNDNDLKKYLNGFGVSISTSYAKNEFLDFMSQIGKDSQKGFKKFIEVFYFDSKNFKTAYSNCEAFRLVDEHMDPKTKKSYARSRKGVIAKFLKFDTAVKTLGLSLIPITMPVILGLNVAEKKAYKNLKEYTSSVEFEVVCRFLYKSKIME